MDELNAVALEHFVYTPVSRGMISYLATAAYNVIQCDPTMMPPPPAATAGSVNSSSNSRLPPTPPKTPPPRAVPAEDAGLPTLEEFITQLVVSSNVQVPTLMSTLVYLNRLKSRLQPMAKGLRCTTHRIFLASLILAAKYLNDSSPKNKHWANYSVMGYHGAFGFSRTEVNLMEKQLLSLLDWDLRITEEDLYRELDAFLAPIRLDVAARHDRRQRRRAAQLAAEEELQLQQQQQERRRREAEDEEAAAWVAAQSAIVYATPPSTPGSGGGAAADRSRSSSRQQVMVPRGTRQESPDSLPGLSSSYTSSSSSSSSSSPPRSIGSSHSYASSLSVSSRGCSGATTPLSSSDGSGGAPYIYDGVLHTGSSLYEPPVEIVLEGHGQLQPRLQQQQQKMMMVPQQQLTKQKSLLPYEISPEELRDLQEGGSRVKRMRGMLGRVFGSGVAVR